MTYLRFGDVDLVTSGPGDFLIEGLSSESGTEWGNPQPVEVTLANLRLGPLVVQDGWEARVAFVAVRVRGITSGALAEAEAALWRETGRSNTLTWQPADGVGAASVFQVMTSTMVGSFDDFAETARLERRYVLRLVCRPFVRSSSLVRIPALLSGAVPTTVTVADGTSTTGWTGNGTVTTSGGFVSVSPSSGPGPQLTLTQSIDCTSTRYVTIRLRREKPSTFEFVEFYADGAFVPVVSSSQRSGDSTHYFRTFTVDVGSQVVEALRIDCFGTGLGDLAVDYVERSNVPPGQGSARQLARTIEVPGAAPTDGSLVIEHDTSALGTVLAYTWRDDTESGWLPPLMPWRTSGTYTADASLVSGGSVEMSGSPAFEVPATMPPGSFVLLARFKSAGVQDVNFTYQLRTKIGANYVGPTISGSVSVNFNSTAWVIKSPAGLLRLPTVPLSATTPAVLEITLSTAGAGFQVELDEAWLFNTDVGRLSWLSVGSGTPAAGGSANRVWINGPTLERPRPEYLIGTAADGSDAYGPTAGSSLMFPTEHVFEAGPMNVFTVTTDAEYADVELDCYPQWPFHAGPTRASA